MSSSPRLQGSRQSRSRSASNVSFRSSRSSPYRNAAQQTSDTGHWRSPRRQRSSSPTRSPSPSPIRQVPRKRFGLNVPTNQPRFVGKFDFEEKYPDDPINEEMGPNGRVWRAFLDECEVFDADMVTEARDGLDLHLVFAGLFSAVLTTFVAQTSQALSTNFPSVSVSLLIEIAALQRAQINGSAIDTIPVSDTTAGPSSFDIWVNALWFTNLALSLGTALITVLVKQWLYQYMSMISGTARDRSLIRHYRFEGLQKWHVLTIIGTLPIVLHVALGLFLAGLVVFLIPLNLPLAFIIGFITLVIYVTYIVSNILPLVYTHCPYRTPFSDILNVLMHPIRALPSLARAQICKIFPSFVMTSPQEAFKTLKEAERIASTSDEVAEDVACSALSWLHRMTSNPPTRRIIVESLGCLSHAMSKRMENIYEGSPWVIIKMTRNNPEGCSIIQEQEKRLERLLRGPRQYPVPLGNWQLDPNAFELPFQTVAALLPRNSNTVVKMESQTWNRDQFLVYLIRQHLNGQPIRLPSALWVRLLSPTYTDGVPPLTGIEDDIFLLSLCNLALENFSPPGMAPRMTPFSGPVEITDNAVPLFQFVVDLIAARLGNVCPTDTFESEALTKLFIIHDYAVSHLHSVGSSDAAFFVMAGVWRESYWMNMLSKNDTQALCKRAENVVLQKLTSEDRWCDSPTNNLLYCYANILNAYYSFCDSHVSSPEFSQKLVSDFCSSLTTTSSVTYYASKALQKIFRKHGTNASVYWTLLLGSFFTTRTLASLSSSRECLYPVMAALTFHFTGSDALPQVDTLQCMNDLSADPQRLYTVCRVIALGEDDSLHLTSRRENWEEDARQHLLQLARFDPTHAVWTQRAHYMSMDPRDWPYLRFMDEDLDDEAKLAEINERMKVGLAVLDEFFASFNQSSRRSVYSWERIRCCIRSIGRILRPPPSNVADMELGLRPSDRVDHSRHIATAALNTALPPQNTSPMLPRESGSPLSSKVNPDAEASGISTHSDVHSTPMSPPVRPPSSHSNILNTAAEHPSPGLRGQQSSEDVPDARATS